jgi:hypothetical protein
LDILKEIKKQSELKIKRLNELTGKLSEHLRFLISLLPESDRGIAIDKFLQNIKEKISSEIIMKKRGRPKGAKKTAPKKRGRPKGAKKTAPKKRGRPKGAKTVTKKTAGKTAKKTLKAAKASKTTGKKRGRKKTAASKTSA